MDTNSNTGEQTWDFLKHPTELGWNEFDPRYRPRILEWCRGKGLEQHAAEDVAQEVLTRLHRSMHSLDRQQSFRAWLYTVTRNATRSYFRDARNRVCHPIEGLDSIESREQELADYVAYQDLLAMAMERTRRAVPEKQWEAFRLRALEKHDYSHLENQLRLTRSVLMNYVSQVRTALKSELAKLENE
jgi:RNA polymerase sigma-70 factor (ECF subfamily)